MMTIHEIREISFRKANIGGYKPEDVDKFIDQVEESYNELINKNNSLIEEIEGLKKKINEYKEDENCIRVALTSAQKMADASIRESRHKAEIIVKDASIKAEKIISSANSQVSKEKRELDRIKAEVNAFRTNLLDTYKSHLKLIQAIPSLELHAMRENREEYIKQPTNIQENKKENIKELSNEKQEEPKDAVVLEPKSQALEEDELNVSAAGEINECDSKIKSPKLKFGEGYDIKNDIKNNGDCDDDCDSPIGLFSVKNG